MHSILSSALFLSVVPSVFAVKSCVFTKHEQIASGLSKCKNIRLQGIVAPTNNSIDLSNLQDNSVVTFAGKTSFAPTKFKSFRPIVFRGKNVTITMAPGGVIDGGGQVYWDSLGSNGGGPKPNTFFNVTLTGGSVIENLNIINLPVHGFSIENSSDLTIRNVTIDNRAGDAPNAISNGKAAAHNTDGFGVRSSKNIKIEHCTVHNQDDCVAVTSGNNITVTGVICTGSHGMSIGSVGGKADNEVANVLFKDSSLTKSSNGLRIKSNFNTTGHIANITFQNIVMSYVSSYGIVIQQDYLNGGPTGHPSNGVLIENIFFKNITGTQGDPLSVNYYVLCGEGSCKNFKFENVKITGGNNVSTCNFPETGCPK
ncbi:related to polygalacturonase precursor [Rhynchosporium secalis]|uniref:endo-polygalacturonase n=1 Tax=Rhynchosporium secalis TaxID=38038 RepID=A0A1E1MM17_RHYSE|nr:related to polygalacturonase precursor [Rhynchosporium secalis]